MEDSTLYSFVLSPKLPTNTKYFYPTGPLSLPLPLLQLLLYLESASSFTVPLYLRYGARIDCHFADMLSPTIRYIPADNFACCESAPG